MRLGRAEPRGRIDGGQQLGAQAMFGEKYGNVVRMVELNGAWSRELCGGTHVGSTAQIGLVNLLGEGSIGSGIRREIGRAHV